MEQTMIREMLDGIKTVSPADRNDYLSDIGLQLLNGKVTKAEIDKIGRDECGLTYTDISDLAYAMLMHQLDADQRITKAIMIYVSGYRDTDAEEIIAKYGIADYLVESILRELRMIDKSMDKVLATAKAAQHRSPEWMKIAEAITALQEGGNR